MFELNTKVLVVDDMQMMRKLVRKACEKLGFSDISEADNGANAWQTIASSSPPFGLIISDWNMPDSSGLDLLKRVRADGRFKALPFILVTAEAEQQQIIEAIKAGVNSYVIKPFNVETLKEKLEAAHKKTIAA